MTERELQIGIFGTFDVENYGDLLFPLIAETELSRRLGPIRLQRFSYQRKTPPDWPYAVTSLTELPAAGNLDGVMIGGGHLIRFDKQVAPSYGPPVPAIHHPTGYWLTPALIALQHGIPVVWNAPGVYGQVPTWADPLMELAVGLSHYVAVRDEPSRQALARFAGHAEIAVVPDTAFGVAQLIEPERPSPGFARLRRDLGLTGPYLVLQATACLRGFPRFLRSHAQLFGHYPVVLLPTGPILCDSDTIFADDLPGLVRLPTWPSPLLSAELIGHAAAVVGTSLHLAITALACGVPVFRPTAFLSGKYQILSGFSTAYHFASEDRIDARWFASRLGRTKPVSAVNEALGRLADHWDRIAEVFSSAGRNARPATTTALGSFWQSLPGLLETWALRHAEAIDERDRALAAVNKRAAAPLRSLGRRLRQWPR